MSNMRAIFLLGLFLFSYGMVVAEAQEGDSQAVLSEVEVVAVTPILGVSLPQERIATTAHVIDADDLTKSFSRDLADALQDNVAAVTTTDVQNSPYQRDLNYRGYTASPLLGVPQGLAIYKNGMRFNEPFGDVVQWDTLPEFAIDSAQILGGASPIFGLNALGGALALKMKNGFDNAGYHYEFGSGSFGRLDSSMSVGYRDDRNNWAAYTGVQAGSERGWRHFSHSEVYQYFGDLRHRGHQHEVSMDVTLAHTYLRGNGPAPLDLIAHDGRRAVFTHPDITKNRVGALNLTGRYDINDNISVQANTYWRFRKRLTINGDEAELEECTVSGEEYLAEEEGTGSACQNSRYVDINGNHIAKDDFAAALGLAADNARLDSGGAYNRSRTYSRSYGGTVQATYEDSYNIGKGGYKLDNLFLAGVSYDHSFVGYSSSSEIGILTPYRGVQLAGIMLGGEVPVGLDATNSHVGIYFMDVVTPWPKLDITIAGRWNRSKIDMDDLRGTDLDGSHTFSKFNPSVGIVWYPLREINVYGNFSEANRAPTAAELGCADPDNACRLPNAFVADPPLKQVKNRSFEAGLRGSFEIADVSGQWTAAFFHGVNRDDIVFVAGNAVGTGYFRNVGKTQRLGFETSVRGKWDRIGLGWRIQYAYVKATYETPFEVTSEAHPNKDAMGRIQVKAGNEIPGIPTHSGIVGLDYEILNGWVTSFDLIIRGEQYYRGDESNQLDKLKGYITAALNMRYRYRGATFFLQIDNLFHQKYSTFGILGDPSEVLGNEYFPSNDPMNANPRFVGAAHPFGVYGGFRLDF